MSDAIEKAASEILAGDAGDAGDSEIAMRLRSLDWSKTPLGATETWSDSLKTAVQILLTELNQVQQSETQRDSDLLQERAQLDVLRQSAQADAFQVQLTHALRPLTDANEIQFTAARVLGGSLGASRVIYTEVLPGGKEVVVYKNYTNGVAELSGPYRLEDFGRDLTDDHRAGQTAIVADVANYPKYTASQKAKYRSIDIAAHIDVPLIKNDQFVALLVVHQATPRQWTEHEVQRVEETAEQTWAAVERARAEAALRESRIELEQQLRKFNVTLSTITDFVFNFDRDGRVLYANQGLLNLWGLTAAEVIGKTLVELLYPEAIAQQLMENVQRVFETKETVKGETAYTSPTGISGYFEYALSPALTDDTTVEFVVGSARDISDRKRVETALRQSEERYRTLFESIDDGLCVIEMLFDQDDRPIDYRFLETNPSFEYQSGLVQVVGKRMLELVPNHEPYWFDIYGGVAKTGESVRFENYAEALNRWFDVYAYRIGQPEQRKVAVLFKDISGAKSLEADRKRAEEISRRSAKLDAFRVSLSDAIRPLADPIEVQVTASRILGEYLAANRVAYFEVRGADYVIERDYVNGADAIAGGYSIDSFGPTLLAEFCAGRTVSVSTVADDPNLSPEQKSAYAAIQIGAYIGIPLIKNGEFVAGLAIHTIEPRTWTPDEVALAEEVAERTWAAVDRAHAEAVAAADLQDMQRLQELASRLVTESDIQTLYQEIMATAIELTRADAGTVQILDEATQDLVLLATQGFERIMIQHFNRVNVSSNTSCGIALTTGVRNFMNFDVPQREDLDGSLQLHVEAGYLSAQSTPLITRSGKPIGMVSTHWRNSHRPSDRELRFLDLLARQAADLIEQRQIIAEREQLLAREQTARAEADRANRIKDEFLAVLSHELRSPLNPILGWSKLLLQGRLDTVKTATALTTIERNAQLQVQLIDDLLDISRILRGKLSLTVMPVDLSTVIAEALETVRLASEAKSIQIHTMVSPGVGIVMGDAGRLQQVMWNLLSNAVKFTPHKGQITITLASDKTHAQIQVSDTGKGIRTDFLPYVFEHFRQEDGATTRKFGGLGLGLAIVRQIVELHGGTVVVDSPGEGQGAAFTARIPLAPCAYVLPENELPTSLTGDLSAIRILVVDDDAGSRELVAFVLEQAGAIVTTAASGVEALEAFSQSVPNLIVSDIGMPEVDGYMLLRQIRNLPLEQGGQIPAIALTAYAGELDQKQALAAGFQRHLAKPIAPEAVVAIVTELVSSASGR
ncbi:GAF domain-containing protein [Phormidium tenue FACHB-886]|nr:GAF domain-containing protein [Phormidium tenue FACHB-886]